MATSPQISLVNLDFDSNKQSLIDYLKTIPEFSGFNYEGSSLSQLLNLLAFTTSQNAFYAHLVANEMFLDTANERRSVVNHAKMLGYTPSSPTASTAVLHVLSNNTATSPTLMPAGSTFIMTIDGKTKYNFCTVDDYSFQTGNNVPNDITVKEGVYKNISYTLPQITAADSVFGNGELRLTIPDKNVDTTSMKVYLYSDDLQTSVEYMREGTSQENQLTGNVFSVQENSSGFFEVILNRALLASSSVPVCLTVANITYVATSGSSANDAFKGASASSVKISFPNVGSVTMKFDSFTEFPYGGMDLEDVDSIKLYAPRMYATQNRAVTAFDYKTLIQKRIPGIESIRVVGGETVNPPMYGKVFISLKYSNRTSIPTSVQAAIDDLIKSNGLATITPVFVEPDYIFIEPSVFVKYQTHITNITQGSLINAVTNTVKDFGKQNLEQFDSNLWNAKFIEGIQKTDASVLSVYTSYTLRKSFSATINSTNSVSLNFGNNLNPGSLSSSPFSMFDTKANVVRQCLFTDDGAGNANISWYNGTTLVFLIKAGTIDYVNGVLNIKDFSPTQIPSNSISVKFTTPNVDVSSADNQILLFDDAKIAVTVTQVKLS